MQIAQPVRPWLNIPSIHVQFVINEHEMNEVGILYRVPLSISTEFGYPDESFRYFNQPLLEINWNIHY
jgi:hypothetical protein